MLSLSKPLSPDHASWYFQRDDYYLAEEGAWYGSLAADLDLSGPIQRSDFLCLLQGFDINGEKLVASAGAKDILGDDGKVKKHGHRSGIDLTFSAPKSVSILSYHDPAIRESFQKALRTTLDHIEREFAYTQTKDRQRKVHAERTANLLWATFEHGTSRELDPQLHCHCVLLNITRDSGGKYKTVHNDPLYKNKMYLGQYFRNQLAEEIMKIGYRIEVTDRKKGFFEISGIGEEVIQAFSKRSQQVRREMKALRALAFKDLPAEKLLAWAMERKKEIVGHPDYDHILAEEVKRLSSSTEKVYASYGDAELAALAATGSRTAKRDVSKEYVTGRIEETCSSLNTSLVGLYQKAHRPIPDHGGKFPPPREILQSAIEGVTEGQSTFSRYQLLADAMKMSIGQYTHDDFEKEFDAMLSSGDIVKLGSLETRAGIKEVFSSKEMIAIEAEIMNLCGKTKGTSTIHIDKPEIDRFLEHMDLNLKMAATLQTEEQDREKAEVKFKTILAQIKDSRIRDKVESLRERILESSGKSPVFAENVPELRELFERFGQGFTQGQKSAARLIAGTKDRFSVIQGDAGTGKSFSCLYSKQILEQNGFYVRGLAPTGKAATGLGAAARISPDRCGTIDSFLLQYRNVDPAARKKFYARGKEVWLVDEAGMCGSRKILELMKIAMEADAKVVFIGDRKQFQSIEAGRMFSELQDKAGIDMVVMPDVMRQKTRQTKEIVKAISLKDFDFAFDAMQGFKPAGESFRKNDCASYCIGNRIQFHEDHGTIPAETLCKVLSINPMHLEIEYFDEEKRIYVRTRMEPQEVHPDAFSVFDPPMNQHPLAAYKLKEYIEVQVPEQGLPGAPAEIAAISNEKLTLSFVDPETEKRRFIEFDPTRNPTNIRHLGKDGEEKYTGSGEEYVDMITVESDKSKCLSLVAQDYLESLSSRKDTLLITGTNKNKDALNKLIRPELQKQGIIRNSREYTVFRSKSLSGAGAMAADSYQPGQVIITNKPINGIPRGVQAEILSINNNKNSFTVRFWDKKTRAYKDDVIDSRKHSRRFSTYDKVNREFGIGDRIIFLKNDRKTVGVNNGEIGRILSIDAEGNVKARILDSEINRDVEFNINNKGPKAYNYCDHAYAITDYKSQGATTQRLIWYAPTSAGPLSSNSFYVAITRCKEEVGVYTDDGDALREKVKQEQQKESTLDYTMDLNSVEPAKHEFNGPFEYFERKSRDKSLPVEHQPVGIELISRIQNRKSKETIVIDT